MSGSLLVLNALTDSTAQIVPQMEKRVKDSTPNPSRLKRGIPRKLIECIPPLFTSRKPYTFRDMIGPEPAAKKIVS